MNINNAGLALIKKAEGLRLKSYLCPAGVPTIGFGHTGPDVHLGQEINEREAEQYLRGDLLRFEHGVEQLLEGCPTTENEFSAMVCLAYNIGLGKKDPGRFAPTGFAHSSVLKFHKAGDKTAAANAFLLWNKAGGKVLNGLVKRRNAERDLYVS